jgi:tRNA-binding EMAP/Myf-like protein
MSLTFCESLSISCITKAYKAFVNGRATTITPANIFRLESIGMVWDAQKGGNRKRKTSDDNDINFMISGRKVKFSLSAEQSENTSSRTMKMSALTKFSGKLHDQDIQERREDALKNIEITNVEELVNNSMTSSSHDSGSKSHALKIRSGPVMKKVTKKLGCDDGDYVTLLNLPSMQNTKASTSLSTTKCSPLLYPQATVNGRLDKRSKIIDAQHKISKTIESNAINPSHSRNCFVPQRNGTGEHELSGFNDLHRNRGTGVAFRNGDATSESVNFCSALLLGYPPKEAKGNHEMTDIDTLPLMTEIKKAKANCRYADSRNLTAAITNANSSGCNLVATKPSELFLKEAFKAGRELTMHMPAESIEEVYFFLETMKWRNCMNLLMTLQNENIL